MRKPPLLAALIAVLLSLALPACGSAQSTPGRRHSRCQGPRRTGPEEDRQLRPSRLHRRRARRPKLLFVVEQPGRVSVLRNGHVQPRPFLDISDQVGYDGGERGLLSIAFPPNYAASGSFYVYYNDTAGNDPDRRIQAP